jgi:hypothetical protein
MSGRILVACAFMVLLMLSAPLILPIRAASELKPNSPRISAATIISAAKQITISQISKDTILIQTPGLKEIVEKLSDSNVKVSYVFTNQSIPALEADYNFVNKTLALNGKTIQLPIRPENSLLKISDKVSQAFSSKHIDNSSFGQTLQSPSTMLLPESISSILRDDLSYFIWDNVHFVAGGAYPHADEDYYNIQPSESWSTLGTKLLHNMIDNTTSWVLVNGGLAATLGAIGAILGWAIGGEEFGAPLGVVLGLILTLVGLYFSPNLPDENNNIWWWVSQDFIWWVVAGLGFIIYLYYYDIGYAVEYVLEGFWYYGYLRVSDTTMYDAVGAGDPDPPTYTYVSSLAEYGYWEYGGVTNQSDIIGTPDGNFAQIYGGNFNDGGYIRGWTDAVNGHIYIYGYSAYGYDTHLYVYTSWNDNYDWTQISSQYVYGDGSGAYWIDCGSSGSFRYIAIVAIDDEGDSANMLIDSVLVIS